MKIKARYFEQGVFPQLQKDIDAALAPFPEFRDELLDKLYDFFHRYFSESGSIYFRYTPLHRRIYEQVYTDDRDVILFWKTHMLYYVKTDRLFQSMTLDVDGQKFIFDASKVEHKKANEKRELIYEFQAVNDGAIVLSVAYAKGNTKTKEKDILKAAKENGIALDADTLDRAIRIFERQSEVDYFINKNARAFLREQFKLWMYQYLFDGKTIWDAKRIRELQTLEEIAFKIIDFIAQFEDELVKIWNKPKFVLNSHYIITLDKLLDRAPALVEKLWAHPNIAAQITEWRDLGMIEADWTPEFPKQQNFVGDSPYARYRFLPLDTKHFPDLELEIIALFDNLDDALDGWLVHSENYQALKTIQPKFAQRVQAIYTDPPYNTDASEIIYSNNYKHSSWMTLLENRLALAKALLKKDGILCITIDHVELAALKSLMEQIYGQENQLGLVSIRNNPSGRSTVKGFSIANEYAIFVGATEKASIGTVPRTDEQLAQYDQVDDKGNYQWRNFLRSGGQNDFREERPRLHYPLFVAVDSARIPEMDWDKEIETWILEEEPRENEQVIYPKTDDGTEYTWRLGVESLRKRLDDLRVRNNRQGKLTIEVKFRLGDDGVLPKTNWDNSLFNATAYGTSLLRSLFGVSQLFSFPKSVYAVEEAIRVCRAQASDFVLDFFAGSGTTAHAVININRLDNKNRKYILIDVGEHFNTVILPRVKKVVFSDKWKDGHAQEGGKGISHFAKYFDLEQYEDTLRQTKYGEDDAPLLNVGQSPYSQYVFLRDTKMLDAVELNADGNVVNVELTKLYPNIDVAETLSCVTGKPIKRITADTVEFTDGTTANLHNPDWHFIKPLIWW